MGVRFFYGKRLMKGKIFLPLLILMVALCSQPGYAWKQFAIDSNATPNSGILSNSFIDILFNDGLLWLGGGRGLSKSADSGKTWITYNKASGLTSDEPSAITAGHPPGKPDEIWVAGSHSRLYDGVSYPFGDGFSRSKDNGQTWVTIVPSDTAASGFGKLAYDLSCSRNSVYAACYYGGLLVHHFNENDTLWHHIYYSPEDSTDWEADHWPNLATGRYYSCAVDTFHQTVSHRYDTLMVYAGSGHGVQKFYYLPKRIKLGGNHVSDIVGEGNTIFLATEGGVTRTDSTLSAYITYDAEDGLGSDSIRSLFMFGGRLWAAPFGLDALNDTLALGIYSADTNLLGDWTKVDTNLFDGLHSGIYDLQTIADSVIYIAAGDSGVVKSVDTGKTWSRFFPDAADTLLTSPRNQVYSIDVCSDTVYFGTKAGLVKATYHAPLSFDFDTLITFPENDTSASFVNLVRHYGPTGKFTWLGLTPQTESGRPTCAFLDSVGSYWTMLENVAVRKIIVIDSTLTRIAAGHSMYTSVNDGFRYDLVKDTIADTASGRIMTTFDMLSLAVVDLGNNHQRVFAGSTYGVGYRLHKQDWRIRVANTDSLVPDLVVQRTQANCGLPGEWVVALDVQPLSANKAVLWAACRSVSDTVTQMTAVAFSTDYGTSWDTALAGEEVWNFAFDSTTVFAATSNGLYYADSGWTNWSKATIIDHTTQDTLISGTEIYCAAVVDTTLWVGSELGLATCPVPDLNDWSIKRIYKATDDAADVFAAPVPYSPINNSGRLSLHYRVPATANVTVEIYDFAMHLVKTVAQDRPRVGGQDYFETWDGYNEKGRMAAAGMYFFKVSLSTGERHWGRLAIIP